MKIVDDDSAMFWTVCYLLILHEVHLAVISQLRINGFEITPLFGFVEY